MVYVSFWNFAKFAEEEVGELHKVPTAKPFPWFCKDIFLPNDIQWAGYIGDFSTNKQALVFGINLEHTDAWKRVLPKIKGNLSLFSRLLCEHKDFEWHWMGRPVQRQSNPPRKCLSQWMWTYQVDYAKWVTELEDILTRKRMWHLSEPMRPQIQVMRLIGLPSEITNTDVIKHNIQQTVLDLQSLVDFIGR